MAQLVLRRGDTRAWNLHVVDPTGAPVSLVGATVWWTVRPTVPADPRHDLPDAEAIVHAWLVHNGTIVTDSGVTAPDGTSGGTFAATDAAGGVLALTLYPRLTTQLPSVPPGTTGPWHYDVQVMRGADAVRTYDDGTLRVLADVTRRTVVP